MKTVIDVKKDGRWFVATDLLTQVADQGPTRAAAIAGVKKALRERHEVLLRLVSKHPSMQVVDVEV